MPIRHFFVSIAIALSLNTLHSFVTGCETLFMILFLVINVYNGDFKIDNVAWDDRLSDATSELFKDMARV